MRDPYPLSIRQQRRTASCTGSPLAVFHQRRRCRQDRTRPRPRWPATQPAGFSRSIAGTGGTQTPPGAVLNKVLPCVAAVADKTDNRPIFQPRRALAALRAWRGLPSGPWHATPTMAGRRSRSRPDLSSAGLPARSRTRYTVARETETRLGELGDGVLAAAVLRPRWPVDGRSVSVAPPAPADERRTDSH